MAAVRVPSCNRIGPICMDHRAECRRICKTHRRLKSILVRTRIFQTPSNRSRSGHSGNGRLHAGSRIPLSSNQLRNRGLNVRASENLTRIHVYKSIAGRSKMIWDIVLEPNLTFLSSSRILLGIKNVITVVSEAFDRTPLSNLYDYVVPADGENLVDICEQTVRDPNVIEFRKQMTERFSIEYSVHSKIKKCFPAHNFNRLFGISSSSFGIINRQT